VSQSGRLGITDGMLPPDVLTTIEGNSGSGSPINNIFEILGTGGVTTSVVGNVLTISAVSSGFTWNTVTSISPPNPIQIMAENGYICAGSSLVTFLLPLAPALGDSFIILSATSKWQVTQNGSQQVTIGPYATTVGPTGMTNSNTLGDKVEFTYIGIFGGAATFIASPPQGTLTLM
jgi:hypothetical protein